VGGEFQWGRFRFRVGTRGAVTGRRTDLYEGDFDARLTSTGRLPDLGGGPIASWALARLRHLTGGGLPAEREARTDGGGYVIEVVAYEDSGRPVAAFQFQGDAVGLGVVGQRGRGCPAEDVLGALAAALAAEPGALRPCRYTVVDPEWAYYPEDFTPPPGAGSRNCYGWDGAEFLGRGNIRERW
jgi:hypothetical protein